MICLLKRVIIDVNSFIGNTCLVSDIIYNSDRGQGRVYSGMDHRLAMIMLSLSSLRISPLHSSEPVVARQESDHVVKTRVKQPDTERDAGGRE